MTLSWATVGEAGILLICIALIAFVCGVFIMVVPWIIMNWILAAGITLLVGLILIVIAYYMDIIRGGT